MQLKIALDFFNSLRSDTEDKKALKLYDQYILILEDLVNRELTATQIQVIEQELEKLPMDVALADRKASLKKYLATFQKFLNQKIALVMKGHYSNAFGGGGLLFGMILGLFFNVFLQTQFGLIAGTVGGLFIGWMIGSSLDKEAIGQGRVLGAPAKLV